METNSTEEEEDRAASAVQGLLKVFRARKAYAKLAQEKREENKRINVEAPFVPTPSAAVDAFCKDFLRKQDFVLDLGCGDGRVLIQASAKVEFAVGVDIQPAPLQRAIEASSSVRNVQWILGDFHDAKVIALLPKVTVVFLFLLPTLLADIARYLVQHVQCGTRICCYTFCLPFAWWKPTKTVHIDSLASSSACTLWEYTVTESVKQNALGL